MMQGGYSPRPWERLWLYIFCGGREIPGVVLATTQAHGRFPTCFDIGSQVVLEALEDDSHLGARTVEKSGRAVLERVYYSSS